jgi:hypothetical protein
MSLLQLALIMLVIWIVYTMLQSYRSMEKELREIRVKCIGKPTSSFTQDPVDNVRTKLVEGLSQLAKMAA